MYSEELKIKLNGFGIKGYSEIRIMEAISKYPVDWNERGKFYGRSLRNVPSHQIREWLKAKFSREMKAVFTIELSRRALIKMKNNRWRGDL